MSSAAKISFQTLLSQIYGESVSIKQIEEQSHGEQGAPGCKVRYYKVHFTHATGDVEIK